MTETHDLVIMEDAVKHTAKAALQHQKQTTQVHKKVTAIGMITNDVHTRLQAISNIDEREFEQLTDVIEGQINLSKQAKQLDQQWGTMLSSQSSELNQLTKISASLDNHHTDRLQAMDKLNALAEQNHIEHTNDLESINKQVAAIDKQLKTLDTAEDLSGIETVLSAVKAQIEQEYTDQSTHQAEVKEKMTDLRTVSALLLTSTGHYTSVIQTVTAKVEQIVSIVNVIDEKVSHLSPGVDGVSQEEIVQMFQRLGEAKPVENIELIDVIPQVDATDESSDELESDNILDNANDSSINENTPNHESKSADTPAPTNSETPSPDDSTNRGWETGESAISTDESVSSKLPPRSKDQKSEPKSKWQFWKK